MCQVHAQGLQSKFGREGKSVLLRCLYSFFFFFLIVLYRAQSGRGLGHKAKPPAPGEARPQLLLT